MSEIKTVCVYCGSSGRVADSFKHKAKALGQMIGRQGLRLVYGGGRVGLMGIVADSALEAGGEVVGIIPEHIQKREIEHHELTELHIVDSMHTRKRMMVEFSDAFIVLPGGFGTLDETFEIITWRQLGLHDKPIVVVDLDGYWTPMLDMIAHMQKNKFVGERDLEHFIVVKRVEDILPALKAQPEEQMEPELRRL